MSGTIICYGDSNTYGYDPRSFMGDRYTRDVRWTGILEKHTDWKIRNHGVNGRCIPHTSSQIRFACEQVLEWVKEETPVWMLIMLGTNDLLQEPGFTAEDAALRMRDFLVNLSETRVIKRGSFRFWLVSPPCMVRGAWVAEDRLCRESKRLGEEYRKVAEQMRIKFTEAGRWNIPMVFDGVHFSEEGHRNFAGGILEELPDNCKKSESL